MKKSLKFNTIFIITILCVFMLPFFTIKVNGENKKNLTLIMGENKSNANKMYVYLLDNNDESGKNPIDEKYAIKFVQTTIKEANREGVRADVAFALMMHETGFLNFTGDVDPKQNNFAGLGTTGGGVKGASFKSMKIGIRAVIQHLKCYACDDELNAKCVDPRWNEILRGKAKYVEHLGYEDNPYKKGWAYPGKGYGKKVLMHMRRINNVNIDKTKRKIKQEKKITLHTNKGTKYINKTFSISLNILIILLLILIIKKLKLMIS